MIQPTQGAEKADLQLAKALAQTLRPMRSPMFEQVGGTIHGVTRRVPGMGKADGNISYTAPRDRNDAWKSRRSWAGATGVLPESLVVPWQIHGSRVLVVDKSHRGQGAAPESSTVARADALVTNVPGVTLMTTHADCLAILLYDPRRNVVGSVHAGWRSTVRGIAENVVATMVTTFQSAPADIRAYFGPAICSECYEVGDDVTHAWFDLTGQQGAHAVLTQPGGRQSFDLTAANDLLLRRTGLSPVNIEHSGECTKCNDSGWFSHRGQGPHTGRFASMITLAETR